LNIIKPIAFAVLFIASTAQAQVMSNDTDSKSRLAAKQREQDDRNWQMQQDNLLLQQQINDLRARLDQRESARDVRAGS
jgi:hypothetical protein